MASRRRLLQPTSSRGSRQALDIIGVRSNVLCQVMLHVTCDYHIITINVSCDYYILTIITTHIRCYYQCINY